MKLPGPAVILILACCSIISSCGGRSGDSVKLAESDNKARLDTTPDLAVTTDEMGSSFLVKVADDAMFQIELGELARKRSEDERVKRFGTMMVQQHANTDVRVKELASSKNVALPSSLSDRHKQIADDLSRRQGQDFDRVYMKVMVDDHQESITEFNATSGKVIDSDIKVFITNVLPTLQAHLDSALLIRQLVGQ